MISGKAVDTVIAVHYMFEITGEARWGVVRDINH
jgi:hypothetical protein